MFNVDHSFTRLTASPRQVVMLLQSINAVSVKVPGIPAEAATAFVVAWRKNAEELGLVIHLYYTAVNQGAAYVPDPPSFPVARLQEILTEATHFLESMGFMLDDSGFSRLSPAAQGALVSRTPVFHELERFAQARKAEVEEDLPEADVASVVPMEGSPKPQPAQVARPSPGVEPPAKQAREERASSVQSTQSSEVALGRLLVSF